MPVSVVCESAANVNAALRESLSSSIGYGADDAKMDGGADDGDSLHDKLAASAKRVLFSKIEYEEVSNYSQTWLDKLKSKYIVLNPSKGGHNNSNNSENSSSRKDSVVTCSGGSSENNAIAMNGCATDIRGETNIGNHSKQRSNSNELPQPKRILYPRENVRIGWKSSTRKWQVGVGMMNVGNTCYLNSTLQALFHVPSMATWLLSDTQHMERCESADAGCIICAMAKTLEASQSSQSAVRPHFVYSRLKAICKHLVMGRQEDAHEFLRYLVEAMEKCYLSRFRNHKDFDQYSKETTPLNQILGGYLKSAVRCLACGHVSTTFQHFQDLLLDIRKADTIEEALEGYFSRERLEDMGYKCEACKKKVSATKQFSLERAPIALCIQLKRFSMLGTKINKQITIKPRLDLTKFASRKGTGEPMTYKLVSLVTHLGASQHCGHYTAIGLTESGTYYNYDDSYVRPISVQSVCNTNAYIIFYEMDTSPARHNATSTQVSGAAHADTKENFQKVNGCAGLTPGLYNGRPSPQRVIGPQLPTAGIPSPFSTNNNNNNNNKSNSPLTNGNKCLNNNNSSSSTPSNGSKIMIHFKNNTTSLKSTPLTPTKTSTVAVVSSNGSPQTEKCLLSGNGKFNGLDTSDQEKKANEPSGLECSSDDGGGEISTPSTLKKKHGLMETASNSKNALPSMPKLFDHSHLLSHDELPSPQLFIRSSHKSLVPYESASDDDEESPTDKITKVETTMKTMINPRKRSSSSSTDDEGGSNEGRAKMQKSGAVSTDISSCSQSNSKGKSDAIDDIFNLHKRNSSTNNNNNNNNNAHDSSHNNNNKTSSNINNKQTVTITPQKKSKFNAQKLQVSTSDDASKLETINGDDNNGFLDHRQRQQEREQQRPQFMRSHSTPPSPPVIKTKTGLWQVTALQPATPTSSASCPEVNGRATTTTTTNNTTTTNTKKLRNPFVTTPTKNDLFTKRPKFSTDKSTAATPSARGNGYHSDAVNDAVVTELLKQNHRPYSTPVLNWNGTESTLHKETMEEIRQQRRHDWKDEEENDMDRGRQKKTKAQKEMRTATTSTTPGYNLFQEHENQRRWKNGNNGTGHRFYGGGGAGNFRRNFHRSKGSGIGSGGGGGGSSGGGVFKRFNYKYHRTQQRGGNSYHNGHHRRTT